MRHVNTKGVALYLVLTILLVVVIMANIILNFVASQGRLAVHETDRIHAIYAAKGALNYALEMLRLNQSPWDKKNEFCICRTNAECNFDACKSGVEKIEDPSLSPKIHYIKITLGALAADGSRSVEANVNYTQ